MKNKINNRRNMQRELETNEMLEVLHQNHNQAVSRDKINKNLKLGDKSISTSRKKLTKEEILILIIYTLILIFAIIAFIISFFKVTEKRNEDFLKNCMKENSKGYCEEILYD